MKPQALSNEVAETTTKLLNGDYSARGALAYVENCGPCHRMDGQGVPRIFPALANSSLMRADNPISMLHITLSGGEMVKLREDNRTEHPADAMNFAMPSFAHLSDTEVSDLFSFIRTAWGKQATPGIAVTVANVQERDVAAVRKMIASGMPEVNNRFIYDLMDAKGNKLAGAYRLPADRNIAQESNAGDILYGKRLLNETKRLLPENSGAQMNCNSCHLANGRLDKGATYINTFRTFPQFISRAGKVVSLTERINGCFARSMNGKPIDPKSNEMRAIIAYMVWLAKGVPEGALVDVKGAGKMDINLIGNTTRGVAIYTKSCAACHGANGEGLKDNAKNILFPALWGDESFNIGAGMARTDKAAAFTKYNMPLASHRSLPLGQGAVLNDQEAVDVAEFFTHQPRPDFPDAVKDWAGQEKPKDARN